MADINFAYLKGDLNLAAHLVEFAKIRLHPLATAELCRLACKIIDPYLEIDPETVVTLPPPPPIEDDEIATEDFFNDLSDTESDFAAYSEDEGAGADL